jgi:hypothetical protein
MNISRGATGAVNAFSSLALLFCASLMILFISATAFLILAAAVVSVIVIFNTNQAKVNAWMTTAIRQDNEFVHAFGIS